VGRFLIWLSGAQRDILDDCRTDRAKYVGIGSAVLVTSSMAAVSMSFALHIALKASLPVAIPFALAWGLAIMSLDRWLVVSMSRNQLLLAVPRVLLGLLFGIIISTPLTLQIFHVEIANQISLDQATAASNFESSLKTNQLYVKVQKDQRAVAADQQVIDSGGGTGTSPANDPVLTSLNAQLKADQQKEQTYYDQWHCEEYGFPGHCTVGNGPAASTSWNSYVDYKNRVASDEQQITAEQQSLTSKNKSDAAHAVTTAQDNLQVDETTLRLDKKALTTVEDSFNSTNAANTGILASLKALDQLRSSNAVLLVAELLLFLFFTSIECLPICVKVLLNLGPMNSYEMAVAKAEQFGLRRAEEEMARQYMRLIRERDQATMESENLHTVWEFEVLPGLVREQAEVQKRIAKARLDRWENRAMARRDLDQDDDRFGLGQLSSFGRPGPDYTNVRARAKARKPIKMSARVAAFRNVGRPVQQMPAYPRNVTPITPAAGNYWPNV
jgi:hypothetical protein